MSISKIEKSNVMEDHYKESSDPWGNTKRQLYQRIFKPAVINALKFIDKDSFIHYDIGAGGGNIVETVRKNSGDKIVVSTGCDISPSAVDQLNTRWSNCEFEVIDCDEYSNKTPSELMAQADLITIVDVMYYFGGKGKRDYRRTLDELWKTFKSGSVIIVADSIIPYQRRSYFKCKSDCKVLKEYIEYSEPVNSVDSDKHRYLKVKIYKKL